MTDTRNSHVAEPFRSTLNGFEDAMRAATDGRFLGSDIAEDGAKLAGCSAKGATEPHEGGVEGSNPSRSTNHPRPLKAAHELMLTKLAAMLPDVPRLSIDPEPEQFEDVADYICEVARVVDQWLLAVGREVKSNASCNVDLSNFTDVALNSVEGFATFDLTRCAERIKEDRAA